MIDYQMARYVMGWERRPGPGWYDGDELMANEEWRPVQSLAQAWQVVRRMGELGWALSLVRDDDDGKTWCSFRLFGEKEHGTDITIVYEACADTADDAPLAICTAAWEAFNFDREDLCPHCGGVGYVGDRAEQRAAHRRTLNDPIT